MLKKLALREGIRYLVGLLLITGVLGFLLFDHRKPDQVLLIRILRPELPSLSWVEMNHGVEQAVTDWNEKGGILGMMVKIRVISESSALSYQKDVYPGETLPVFVLDQDQTDLIELFQKKKTTNETPIFLILSGNSISSNSSLICWNYPQISSDSRDFSQALSSCLTSGKILYVSSSTQSINREFLLKMGRNNIVQINTNNITPISLSSVPGNFMPDWIVLDSSLKSTLENIHFLRKKYPHVPVIVPSSFLLSQNEIPEHVFSFFYFPGSNSGLSRFMKGFPSGQPTWESLMAYQCTHAFLETCQSQKTFKKNRLLPILMERKADMIKQLSSGNRMTGLDYRLYDYKNGLFYEKNNKDKN